MKKTDYDRYNVSAKLDMKPNRRVKLGLTADMSMQHSNSPSLNVDPFKYAYFANPYEQIYNENGSYAADNTYYAMRHANGSYDTKLPKDGYNILASSGKRPAVVSSVKLMRHPTRLRIWLLH